MGVFRRQNVWWIDYYAQGQRKRERVGPSHRLAEDVLSKRKAEVAEGKFFPARQTQSTTFKEIAQVFIQQYAQHKKSAETLTLRTNKLVDILGDRRLCDITPLMVQDMRNKIKAARSVSTANRYHAVLRAIFNRAKDWRMFYGENPASIAKMEKEPPNRLRYLSEHEITKLLTVCDSRILPIVIYALTTGMRRGEILGLKWLDLDLKNGIIYLTITKSGKAREIPMMDKLRTMFLDMPQTGDKVFDVPKITLRRHFDKALKQAGIAGFRFHDLRHTFASHFIMRTGNLPVLQNILGHSTPLLTQRYAHLSMSHLTTNMALLDTGWTPIWTPRPTIDLTSVAENANIVYTGHAVPPR